MNSQAGRYNLKSFAEGSFRIAVAPGRGGNLTEILFWTSSPSSARISPAGWRALASCEISAGATKPCTRRGAALVNSLAQEVLFVQAGQTALGRIPADYESNPDNFEETTGTLKEQQPEPLDLAIYEGLRVRLTRNVDKPNDFVNGMSAIVQDFDSRTGAIVVETETSHRLCVYPVTDDGVPVGRVTYYSIRLGYADTVHKFQGAELPHVTFWPDRAGCPAAGYVALSRVRKDSDYLLAGCVTSDHFVPAM